MLLLLSVGDVVVERLQIGLPLAKVGAFVRSVVYYDASGLVVEDELIVVGYETKSVGNGKECEMG